MNRMLPAIFAITLSLLLAQAAADSPIYRWVDENGVTHFAAQPPGDGRSYETIGEVRSRGTAAPAATVELAEDADEARGELPELPTITLSQPDPAVVAERCNQARDNLRHLSSDAPILLQSEGGGEEPLSDERRREVIAETRAFIAEWCR